MPFGIERRERGAPVSNGDACSRKNIAEMIKTKTETNSGDNGALLDASSTMPAAGVRRLGELYTPSVGPNYVHSV